MTDRMEHQLVEARYGEAVENAVEGVFRTTPGGRFLMANRALARMLGYDNPEQLIAERARFRRLARDSARLSRDPDSRAHHA